MSIKIESPATEYTAVVHFGETELAFVEGVAVVDDLPVGVSAYLRGAGYVLTVVEDEATEPDPEPPVDPEPAPKPRRKTA